MKKKDFIHILQTIVIAILFFIDEKNTGIINSNVNEIKATQAIFSSLLAQNNSSDFIENDSDDEVISTQ